MITFDFSTPAFETLIQQLHVHLNALREKDEAAYVYYITDNNNITLAKLTRCCEHLKDLTTITVSDELKETYKEQFIPMIIGAVQHVEQLTGKDLTLDYEEDDEEYGCIIAELKCECKHPAYKPFHRALQDSEEETIIIDFDDTFVRMIDAAYDENGKRTEKIISQFYRNEYDLHSDSDIVDQFWEGMCALSCIPYREFELILREYGVESELE